MAHRAVFGVDDIAKVDEMDNNTWTTKGTLLETCSFEIVVGSTEADELWAS